MLGQIFLNLGRKVNEALQFTIYVIEKFMTPGQARLVLTWKALGKFLDHNPGKGPQFVVSHNPKYSHRGQRRELDEIPHDNCLLEPKCLPDDVGDHPNPSVCHETREACLDLRCVELRVCLICSSMQRQDGVAGYDSPSNLPPPPLAINKDDKLADHDGNYKIYSTGHQPPDHTVASPVPQRITCSHADDVENEDENQVE